MRLLGSGFSETSFGSFSSGWNVLCATERKVGVAAKAVFSKIWSCALPVFGMKGVFWNGIAQYRLITKKYLSKLTKKTSEATRKIFNNLKEQTVHSAVQGALCMISSAFSALDSWKVRKCFSAQPVWSSLAHGAFVLTGVLQLVTSLKRFMNALEIVKLAQRDSEREMGERLKHAALIGMSCSLSFLVAEAFTLLGLWGGYVFLFGLVSLVTGFVQMAYEYIYLQPPNVDQLSLQLAS